MSKYVTAETVSPGHPDKIADQIYDAILDAMLKDEPDSSVACDTLVNDNLGVWEADDEDDLIEEVTCNAGWCIKSIDYEIQLK